jgi:hypothetical protein
VASETGVVIESIVLVFIQCALDLRRQECLYMIYDHYCFWDWRVTNDTRQPTIHVKLTWYPYICSVIVLVRKNYFRSMTIWYLGNGQSFVWSARSSRTGRMNPIENTDIEQESEETY